MPYLAMPLIKEAIATDPLAYSYFHCSPIDVAIVKSAKDPVVSSPISLDVAILLFDSVDYKIWKFLLRFVKISR